MEEFKNLFEAVRTALVQGTPVEQMPAIVQHYIAYERYSAMIHMAATAWVGIVALLVSLWGFWKIRSDQREVVYMKAWIGAAVHVVAGVIFMINLHAYLKVTYTPLLFLSERAIQYFKQLAQAL